MRVEFLDLGDDSAVNFFIGVAFLVLGVIVIKQHRM